MPTPNLQITHIASMQDEGEVPANASADALDNAMNSSVTKQISTDDQLTTEESRENTLITLDNDSALSADFTLDMADTEKRWLTIYNLTGFVTTLRNSAGGGTTIELLSGFLCVFYYDGTDLTEIVNNFPGLVSQGDNVIINGAMQLAQRGTSFTGVSDDDYTLDRWVWQQVGGELVVAISQETTIVPPGFDSSLKIDVTTPETSMAAGDYGTISQRIEGYNVEEFELGLATAKDGTLSFWIRSATTGTGVAAFSNSAGTRSYVTEFTIDAVNTWEKKVVTLTMDTTGTWVTGNGIGIVVRFSFGVGSTFQGTVDTWEAADDFGTAGGTEFWTDTDTVIYIGGVQFEVNPNATAFGRRRIGEELALCQRYYWKTFIQGTAPAQNAGNVGAIARRVDVGGAATRGIWISFPVVMQMAPAITFYNPGASNALWRNIDDVGDSGAASILSNSDRSVFVNHTQVSGDTASERCLIHLDADAEL